MMEQNTLKNNYSKSQYKILMQDFFNTQFTIYDEDIKMKIYDQIQELQNELVENIMRQDSIKLWIDGSYNINTKKSGVGIVIVTDENYNVDQIHNFCFGKTVKATSSIEAEIYALSIGISYLLSKFDNIKNLQINYDCAGSIVCATNIDNFISKGSPYTNFKSALKQLKKRKINTIFTHTKAHDDDPYNIVCDLVAKHYARINLMKSQQDKIKDYIGG